MKLGLGGAVLLALGLAAVACRPSAAPPAPWAPEVAGNAAPLAPAPSPSTQEKSPASPSTLRPAMPTASPTPIRRPTRTPQPARLEEAQVPIFPPVPDRLSPPLEAVIAESLAGERGAFGVAVKHLGSGEMALLRGDQVFPAASLYKLPVMYEAFRQQREGRLSFEEVLTVTEKAAYYYQDGEPTLPVGSALGLGEALERMITWSDNTAAHVLHDHLEVWRINYTLRQLGLQKTQVLTVAITSPLDTLRLLEAIATGRAVDLPASRVMLGLLLRQEVRDRLPRFLPPSTPIAHKTANWKGIRHDAGIVYAPHGAFVVVVLAAELEDEVQGSKAIARLAEKVYGYLEVARPAPKAAPTRPPAGLRPAGQ